MYGDARNLIIIYFLFQECISMIGFDMLCLRVVCYIVTLDLAVQSSQLLVVSLDCSKRLLELTVCRVQTLKENTTRGVHIRSIA